jgi:hypothetical protein
MMTWHIQIEYFNPRRKFSKNKWQLTTQWVHEMNVPSAKSQYKAHMKLARKRISQLRKKGGKYKITEAIGFG